MAYKYSTTLSVADMCVYSISVSEMQTRLEFDIDSNGEVSEDEAKVTALPTFFYLSDVFVC